MRSKAQTWVNTVNTVGIMGKGVALAFKRRFPDMYDDYVRRCDRHEVKLGHPYIFKRLSLPWIINFPTKDHWRSVSRLADIDAGLAYLKRHYRAWGVTSLAVPPLGCGQGQLEWSVVGPSLYRHLRDLDIPVELYAPFGTPENQLSLAYLGRDATDTIWASQHRLPIGAFALVEVLHRVRDEPYHWPIGRVMFQKMAYFASESGIPTGLQFVRGSYGPFSPEVAKLTTQLVNNGLVREWRAGRMFAVEAGPTYKDARRIYASTLEQWRSQIDRLVDLFMRIRTTEQAELAATVHFAAKQLATRGDVTEADVLDYVLAWKGPRGWIEATIVSAVRELAVLGWLPVSPTAELTLPDAAIIG